jgi:hypothetical protein
MKFQKTVTIEVEADNIEMAEEMMDSLFVGPDDETIKVTESDIIEVCDHLTLAQAIASVPVDGFHEFYCEGDLCGIANNARGFENYVKVMGWESTRQFEKETGVSADELLGKPFNVSRDRVYMVDGDIFDLTNEDE